ncbi:MAG: excisionase family DNA-binding protein [Candidatus Omnitrophica bacterium]|nr:excisionase family DNA-binding protein [Candidatus Omnitrophota bacterium]MDD5352576.1 excisionase family DNA-binding protein [Candidatus Omnitrophota bacterium]MDD5550174.1 excisionase family DNA-binding protein [Candidatus Omnitrophota bacterium]
MKEKLLTIREASQYLGITEGEIIELSEKSIIPAYKVGGVYLRFKQEQLDAIKDKIIPTAKQNSLAYSFRDKISDFFYYNDFYIFALLIISILSYLVVYL